MSENKILKDFKLKCRRSKDLQDQLKLQFAILKECQARFGEDYKPIRRWYSFLNYYLFTYCPICGKQLQHNVAEEHHGRGHSWKDVIYFCTECGYDYADTHG